MVNAIALRTIEFSLKKSRQVRQNSVKGNVFLK